ncbi:MAG: hypothetical protein CVU54_00290 [Deltaproteobacteria bacterium HGW-Deltaproteobacteria-12]|jgi:hypothetical protein|nr:MAG: hypothetical protein CVU54_00290 [Deltaproteobacteria bacterium HGW-Deltaproteobacteria-12]
MTNLKYSLSLIVFLALTLVVIGCAKPPEAEKLAAKTAMDAAMSAGADMYAATDFKSAKSIWDASEAQMNDKKYDEAKQGYVSARAAFEKAVGAAAAGKKAMTDEANAAVAALEDGWKKTAAAAKIVQKKMKGKQDAWMADAQAFEDGLKATKDMIAADPIGAKKKAGELQFMLDKWDATFKELAAAPVKTVKIKKGKKKK